MNNALARPKAVLNMNCDSRVRYDFSPAIRVFDASGARSCIITDYWGEIDFFSEPGTGINVAKSGDEVAATLVHLCADRARSISEAAFKKVLDDHMYSHRAEQLEKLLYSSVKQQDKALA